MVEWKIDNVDDSRLLQRFASVATMAAVGVGLASDPVAGLACEAKAYSSPTAIIVECKGARLSALDIAPLEVKRFVSAHKISAEVRLAEQLVKGSFPSGSVPTLQIEADPEAEEKWLVIDIAVRCDVDAALLAYNEVVSQWIAAAPPEARNLVRITFNLS